MAALLESGDDGELQKLLEGMMGQLMSRDVLYEPLKELNDKVGASFRCAVLYLLMKLSVVPILSLLK